MQFRWLFVMVACGGLASSLAITNSRADSWQKMDDPNEISQLISDKMMDGRYWRFYFRSDGKMAYEQGGFTSVREWKINAEGKICMNIYSMPDKVLSCETMSRTDGTPVQYRLEGKTGKSEVQIVDPDQALVEAVVEKAGAAE